MITLNRTTSIDNDASYIDCCSTFLIGHGQTVELVKVHCEHLSAALHKITKFKLKTTHKSTNSHAHLSSLFG